MAKQRVINIRGTSGSGKSTLIRRLVELYPEKEPVFVPNRRQPLFYKLRGEGLAPVSLLGHYETACGGCDTIPSMDRIYELVRERLAEGDSVLYEGLLISAEVNRAVALHNDGFDLTVVRLDTPVELCIDSVNQRRWAKDPEKPPVNPKNTEAKFKQTLASSKKLAEAGVKVVEADREEAFNVIKQLLEA